MKREAMRVKKKERMGDITRERGYRDGEASQFSI
jgi:hypothetical protein